MFTGIVRAQGLVLAPAPRLRLRAPFALGRGDSLAVNGACLSVVRRLGRRLDFDVSPETLRLTNLGSLRPGETVNLEPPLKAGDALGGHMVSGHVDACLEILELGKGPFKRLRVRLPRRLAPYLAWKGSVAVDGVSLTVTRVGPGYFESVLVPETLRKTTLGRRRPSERVNVEVDLLARYLARLLPGGANR